jgi:hypothetical protein
MHQGVSQRFSRFREVADQFCFLVDSARNMNRGDLALKIYQLLPSLIGEAIGLPDLESSEYGNHAERKKARMSQEHWSELYSLLKEKFGDWNLYSQVFDPTKDREAIRGSLADDIADIYRDLKEGLILHDSNLAPPNEILWNWRSLFYSHWGPHAMDALRTIHFLLEPKRS